MEANAILAVLRQLTERKQVNLLQLAGTPFPGELFRFEFLPPE
jgi:hypothetical protein